jgi:internalin A
LWSTFSRTRHKKIYNLLPLETLSHLQGLYISNTFVNDLTPLKGLSQLKELDISSTQVHDLTPLKKLKYLQILSVSSTLVSDLTSLKDLEQLQMVDISETNVSDLTPFKVLIEKNIEVKWKEPDDGSSGIYVKNCPLNNPPVEIVMQQNDAILRYWAETIRTGKKNLNEARLLIVGQGGAGKTTLKEKLKNPNAPLPSADGMTRGIIIESIVIKNTEGEDFTLHIWDFGGQNIQHYAHQFFMSDGVLYALLSNEREQNSNFQYWLEAIKLLGKESPIVIILNEKNGHQEPLKNSARLQEYYPNIQHIRSVNLAKAANDPDFHSLKTILELEIQQLPYAQKKHPTSFYNIRYKLQKISKTQPVIDFYQFIKLCEEEGIKSTELIEDYARTFTILGIALHFNVYYLREYVFLDHKWIIDSLFKLIFNDKIIKQNGRFSETDANDIWNHTEFGKFKGGLLPLIEHFELCYRIEGTKPQEYIVPQRLRERKEPFKEPNATQLFFKYEFMPKGILIHLICRLHNYIKNNEVWSDAVQFTDKKGINKVFVRETSQEHLLEINAFGLYKESLQDKIIETLDDIHSREQFSNLKVQKLMPCPCRECTNTREQGEKPHFFDYLRLNRLLSKGIYKVMCDISDENIHITEILKQSGIQAFKPEKIRDLISKNHMKEAFNLVNIEFPQSDDLAILMMRFTELEHDSRNGGTSISDYNTRKAKIAEDFLKILPTLTDI